MKAKYFFITAILLCGTVLLGYAPSEDTTTAAASNESTISVPWDTLVSRMQLILSLSLSDSGKSASLKHLFETYKVTPESYAKFYKAMRTESVQSKQAFITQISNIIQGYQHNSEPMKPKINK